MKPDMILQADLLDILFEGKNKEYGAYSLRKQYNGRVIKSLVGMLTLVALFAGGYYWAGLLQKDQTALLDPQNDPVILQVVDLPRKAPEPLKPMPRVQKPVATIKSVTPVIVPDEVKADPPPTIDELEKEIAAIGSETRAGEPPTGISSPADGEPAGTGITPAPAAPPVEENRVLPVADKMPEFPGGTEGLRRFLGRNLRVPEEALETGQRVKVPVRFVVNKDGQLSGVEFLAAADEVFKKEVLRVVAKMPRFIPGSQGGKNVAVYFSIPIIFEVQE